MYIYIYIFMYIYVYICVYIYIYIYANNASTVNTILWIIFILIKSWLSVNWKLKTKIKRKLSEREYNEEIVRKKLNLGYNNSFQEYSGALAVVEIDGTTQSSEHSSLWCCIHHEELMVENILDHNIPSLS